MLAPLMGLLKLTLADWYGWLADTVGRAAWSTWAS
jgi:hypothetical protein